jgi:hypothetical protein
MYKKKKAEIENAVYRLLLFRRLVQTWYQRNQESEKLRLRLLQKQLRDKVEELKKKTAYYSTKELLDRYEEKTKLNSVSFKAVLLSSFPTKHSF